jgi:hypothetical protein
MSHRPMQIVSFGCRKSVFPDRHIRIPVEDQFIFDRGSRADLATMPVQTPKS